MPFKRTALAALDMAGSGTLCRPSQRCGCPFLVLKVVKVTCNVEDPRVDLRTTFYEQI